MALMTYNKFYGVK